MTHHMTKKGNALQLVHVTMERQRTAIIPCIQIPSQAMSLDT